MSALVILVLKVLFVVAWHGVSFWSGVRVGKEREQMRRLDEEIDELLLMNLRYRVLEDLQLGRIGPDQYLKRLQLLRSASERELDR